MRAFVIKHSDIVRCPRNSFAVEHYRDDGSCLCPPKTVKELQFDATGEVFVKDTHTTEAEQNGYRETQMCMDIGPGERPIEELPMFSNALEESEENGVH